MSFKNNLEILSKAIKFALFSSLLFGIIYVSSATECTFNDDCPRGEYCKNEQCIPENTKTLKQQLACKSDGQPCAGPSECCTLICNNSVCGVPTASTPQACKSNGQLCAGPSECCSLQCLNNICGVATPTSTPSPTPTPVYLSICGNAMVDLGEVCDPPNGTNGCQPYTFCNSTCSACESSSTSACGNGIVDAGEGCDDGNLTSCDGCSINCKSEICGNGIIDDCEECDDGNTNYGDGCSNDCKKECSGTSCSLCKLDPLFGVVPASSPVFCNLDVCSTQNQNRITNQSKKHTKNTKKKKKKVITKYSVAGTTGAPSNFDCKVSKVPYQLSCNDCKGSKTCFKCSTFALACKKYCDTNGIKNCILNVYPPSGPGHALNIIKFSYPLSSSLHKFCIFEPQSNKVYCCWLQSDPDTPVPPKACYDKVCQAHWSVNCNSHDVSCNVNGDLFTPANCLDQYQCEQLKKHAGICPQTFQPIACGDSCAPQCAGQCTDPSAPFCKPLADGTCGCVTPTPTPAPLPVCNTTSSVGGDPVLLCAAQSASCPPGEACGPFGGLCSCRSPICGPYQYGVYVPTCGCCDNNTCSGINAIGKPICSDGIPGINKKCCPPPPTPTPTPSPIPCNQRTYDCPLSNSTCTPPFVCKPVFAGGLVNCVCGLPEPTPTPTPITCGNSHPTCNGPCPAAEPNCVNVGWGCVCKPNCINAAPSCGNGVCPGGIPCNYITSGTTTTCSCSTPTPTPTPITCGNSYPACNGPCPAAEPNCVNVGWGCVCKPNCINAAPSCGNGVCPGGIPCNYILSGGTTTCSCSTPTPTPITCGNSYPTCNGPCPAAEPNCVNVGWGCVCKPNCINAAPSCGNGVCPGGIPCNYITSGTTTTCSCSTPVPTP